MSAPAQSRPRPARKRPGAEWLPRQHGAWAMLFLPYFAGAALRWGEETWPAYLWPLLPAWLLGYFAFNALSLWLRSGRRPAHLRAALTYGAATGAFGLLAWALHPPLIGWLPLFAPPLGVGLWRAARRDDASLLARGSAVLAACLMCAVAGVPSPGEWLSQPLSSPAWVRTLLLTGYFLGTLLYVKTMIRERGDRNYYAASVLGHVLALTAVALAARAGVLGWPLVAFFALLTLRAAAVPHLERWRGRRTTPKEVGLLEVALSAGLLLLLLLQT